jgi:Flp pilus assembly protein TadG
LPDEGAALVEMAVSISVFLSVLVGVFFVILALYSYHFVADAAREASRYASVRGSQCSTNTPSLPDCPISTSAPLQSWVRGLKYPYAASLNVTVSYLKPTVSGSPATTTWSACPACNAPGNMVKVSVTYGYPLSIPFWKSTTVNMATIPDLRLDAGLPANIDAEKTILGAILLDNAAHSEAAEKLDARRLLARLASPHFSAHDELMNAQRAVDIVTLANELARYKEIESVGGVAYLASLTEGLPRGR